MLLVTLPLHLLAQSIGQSGEEGVELSKTAKLVYGAASQAGVEESDKNTIYFFFNPQCGIVKKSFKRIIPRLKEEYLENSSLSLEFVPLFLSDSKCEAKLTHSYYCINEQGRLLPYLSLLIGQGSIDHDSCNLSYFAKLVGADLEKFKSCQKEERYLKSFERIVELAEKYENYEVPTLIYRGEYLDTVDFWKSSYLKLVR